MLSNGTSGDVMPADTASSETADMGIYDYTGNLLRHFLHKLYKIGPA